MRRILKPIVYLPLQCLSALLSGIIILAKIVRHWAKIAQSDVLVVYHDYGFGFTIHGVDAVRRVYRGRKVTVFYLFQRTRHNPLVARIWPDINLIFLPIEFALGTPGHYRKLPSFLGLKSPWPCRLLGTLLPKKTVVDQFEIDRQMRASAPTAEDRALGVHWFFGYAHLLKTVPVPAPRLPLPLRQKVEDVLAGTVSRRERLCCLYLRMRGDLNDVDASSWRRIGSPLQSYYSAMRQLNDRGYTILLVGDRRLDEETKRNFGSGVLDSKSLGISHDLLYLYAASESDIAVLECGGGSWLPIYCNIPHIVVNVLPFEFASPGGTLYFKSVLQKNGLPEDPRILFGTMASEYDFPGYSVVDNSEEELRDAVADFLDHLSAARPWGIAAGTLADLPRQSWHRALQSGISPVWLKRYGVHTEVYHQDVRA